MERFSVKRAIIGETIENQTFTNATRRAVEIGTNDITQQDTWSDVKLRNLTIKGVRPISEERPVSNGICLFGKNFVVQDVHIEDVAGSPSDCEGYYQKARHSVLERVTLLDAGSEQGAVAHKGRERDEKDAPQGFDNDIIKVTVEFSKQHNDAARALGTPTHGFFAQNSELRYQDISVKGATGYGVYSSQRRHRDLSFKNVSVEDHLGEVAVCFQHFGQDLSLENLHVKGAKTALLIDPRRGALTNIRIQHLEGDAEVGIVLKGELGVVSLSDIALPIIVEGTVERLELKNTPEPRILGRVGQLNGGTAVNVGLGQPVPNQKRVKGPKPAPSLLQKILQNPKGPGERKERKNRKMRDRL
jgi:hypothetical protein